MGGNVYKIIQKQPSTRGPGLDRREFTALSVMAMLAGVTVTITACGGGSGGGGGSPTQPSNDPGTGGDKLGNVSNNHGHTARIAAAELTAGNAVTLQIQGSADHPHTLTLTADEVISIRNGQRVGKATSEDDFHTHRVDFN
jgi:hypothetical protein